MRFSVVTVTYNAERYIGEALRSVAEQEFSGYEHIVWDGGSSDGTLGIVSQYPDVVVRIGEDSGISDAMNKGASFARGEYLIHLHADDLLYNSMVLRRLDTFLRQRPGCKWAYGVVQNIDENGIVLGKGRFIGYDSRRLRRYNIISHPGVVISRSLFTSLGGFDVGLRYCMDYDMWLRCAEHDIAAYPFPGVVASFRQHAGSLSTVEQEGVALEAYMVRNRYVRTLWDRWRSYRTWRSRLKAVQQVL